ncbi:MAG TPA: hypothetical protein VLC28_14095, partial [Flavitalea sp.]|nr:hypothetical protein [Flavitalea sp.]
LLTDDGGILVSTPKSKSQNSRLITRTEIDVSEDGSAVASRSIFCSGDEKELFDQLRQLNNDDKKSGLVKYLNYRVPDDYLLTFKGDTLNGYGFDYKGAYSQLFEFKAGSKAFFPQTVSRISDEELKMDTARKIEYLFDHPYERIDTTVFILPKTMGVETILPAKSISTDLASYRFETSYDEASNKLQVISHLVLRENLVPPNQYQSLASFFSAVNRNQDQKLVIKLKE